MRKLIFLFLLATGTAVAQTSGTQVGRIVLAQNASLSQKGYTAGGTITLGQLVTINSSGQVIAATTSTSQGVIGIAKNSAVSSGPVDVAMLGEVSALADGACTTGNLLTISALTAGYVNCTASPPSKQALGISFSTIGSVGGITAVLEPSGLTTGVSASQVYPGVGIANSTGAAWGTSYTAGILANNLVQLNSLAQLPGVSAANLINFPTLNQSTSGNAATATALAATPTQCSSGTFAQGITATGNANCASLGSNNTTTICSGSQVLGTALIAAGAAASTVTVTCTGLATTDNVELDFNGSPLAVTGYIPSTSGMLTIIKWPSSNTINISVVNNTANSITPGSITLNYRVVR
jgi:hypothetical protein